MTSPSPGRLVVISGPSGVGKSTVVRQVLVRLAPRLSKSVSATTRSPRAGESDGLDYHFLTPAEFSRRRQAGDFLECVEVFGQGHWYGTLWSEIRASLAAGKWVVLEIDVAGARKVAATYPDAVTIFIRPESPAELERRLRARGTEEEDAIARRLATARHELAAASDYQHQVVNVEVDQAVEEICGILRNRGFKHD